MTLSQPLLLPPESAGEAPSTAAGTSGDPLGLVLALVLDSVPSLQTKRQYAKALVEFAHWRQGRPFTRATVNEWRTSMEAAGLAPSTVNQRLSAVRKLAREAASNGLIGSEQAAGITQVAGAKQRGTRTGNWLTKQQAQALIEAPAPATLIGRRDRCALALLVGCGLRRAELADLTFEHIQQREGRWIIIDLRGKGGRIRSIPVPSWVKAAVDNWSAACGFAAGRILRGMNRHNQITHDSLSGNAILNIAIRHGKEIGVEVKAHDLRRTCAKLCRKHGGELEQIQLLLGHASVQTTERYLGTKQDFTNAPNDRMGLKWREEP